MASDSNSTSMVAIIAILLMVAIGGLVAWKMGVFGGGGDDGGDRKTLDVNVNT